MLQCKASKRREFGYQVPPAQKESITGASRKMVHGCAEQQGHHWDAKINAGIMDDAGGLCLEAAQGANRPVRYPQ
jgi:hypothetical protein